MKKVFQSINKHLFQSKTPHKTIQSEKRSFATFPTTAKSFAKIRFARHEKSIWTGLPKASSPIYFQYFPEQLEQESRRNKTQQRKSRANNGNGARSRRRRVETSLAAFNYTPVLYYTTIFIE